MPGVRPMNKMSLDNYKIPNRWVDDFCNIAKSKGLECVIINRVRGWTETILIKGYKCYTKSVSYYSNRRLYFQGVDTKKLEDKGDKVLICGGMNKQLKDIFIIPWNAFFLTLKAGEPINTYKPPKEYYQYKFYIRDRDSRWIMTVQGGQSPTLDITKWRFDVNKAINIINKNFK